MGALGLGTRLIALGLALGWIGAWHAAAGDEPRLPDPTPGSEQVLVGPDAPVTPATLRRRGAWTVEKAGVTPHRRVAPPGWFWLAGGAGAAFLNGVLRARFNGGGRIEATLLFRMRAGGRATDLGEGYGLRICGRFAWLVRAHAGRLERLEHKVFLKPPQRGVIEVLLYALGPHLVASLYDPCSGEHLATLSTHAASGLAGAVGLMAGCDRKKPTARLERLSLRSACEGVGQSRTPGPPVVVCLPTEPPTALVEPDIALETLPGPPPVRVVRTDPAGLERMYCAGRSLLKVSTDLPWKYLDRDLLAAMRQAPVRTPRGFRIDQSYKDPALVEQLLRGWSQRYPDRTRLEQLGVSRQGRPILALAIGNRVIAGDPRPSVLLDGAHHGDEILSTEFVLAAIQTLLEADPADARVGRWLDELVVWCVPLVNPDGLHAFVHLAVRAGRKNGLDLDGDGRRGPLDGVDLNRNYPFRWGQLKRGANPISRYYHGAGPASEPETQAMMRLAERERFVASISYHMGTLALLAPYTIAGVKNPEPDEAWSIAEQVAASLPVHPEGRRIQVVHGLYPVDGVDQDWLRHSFGTVALLLEGAGWPPPLDIGRKNAIIAALRPAWEALLDRFLDGPGVSGRVVLPDGNPVEVEVRIREQVVRAGEVWTTRPRDGRFDRYLPAAGEYQLQIVVAGRVVLEQAVRVGAERVGVDLRVPAETRPGP